MLKKIFFNKPKLKGMIGYLKLDDLWFSCSPDEQKAIIKYHNSGLGVSSTSSPIKGDILNSSMTPLKYLSSMIGWAVADKNYTLADKIINIGNTIKIFDSDLLDAHYFWQESAECYYKQREIREDALQLTIQFCLKDIEMFPQYSIKMKQDMGVIPRIITFQRLAIIYEKNKQYDKAIELCKLAISYDLTDSTKGGYSKRLEKLQKLL